MSTVRFGLFDFDSETNLLRRERLPVHLQSQPAQVLGPLLSHAGEIVSRESLCQTVWGRDTYVDFDRSLNFCIAQVRSALGDSAESPRYIRTLPKRGYQFIAPVHGIEVAAPAPQPSRRGLVRAVIPAAAAAMLGSGLLAWKRAWAPPGLPQIAIARFDNETGNPDFDRFAEGLTDTLVGAMTGTGTGRYAVIGNAQILLTPRTFRDLPAIARTLQVSFVILGQIQRNPTSLRVLAHLIRVPAQTHISVERIDCDEADLLRTESDLAKQIATRFNHRLSLLT